MSSEAPGIVILESKIEQGELARLVRLYFEDITHALIGAGEDL